MDDTGDTCNIGDKTQKEDNQNRKKEHRKTKMIINSDRTKTHGGAKGL